MNNSAENIIRSSIQIVIDLIQLQNSTVTEVSQYPISFTSECHNMYHRIREALGEVPSVIHMETEASIIEYLSPVHEIHPRNM